MVASPLSAVKLIKMGLRVLSPEIGKAIVLTSLVAARQGCAM